VVHERKQTQNKALIGGGVLLILAAAFGGWWMRARAKDDVRIGVTGDQAQFIDIDVGLEKSKGPGGTFAGGVGRGNDSDSGNKVYPTVGGGSCEGARANYVEQYKLANGDSMPPDLTAGAYGAVLNRGTYLNSCGVPGNMAVSVCAAVQNGVAVGVSVRTDPPNAGISSCVAGAVRGLPYPSHPRMDIATTHFKAE
jgi:hypothetical protein